MRTLTAKDLSFGVDVSNFAADRPAEQRGVARDAVKLLVIERDTGALTHSAFRNLPEYLHAGDVVVVNSSKTIPARLHAESRGQHHFIHLGARLLEHRFIIERRGSHGEPIAEEWETGEVVSVLDNSGVTVTQCSVVRKFHPNSRLWEVQSTLDLYRLAPHVGAPIRYGYLKHNTLSTDYETIFGKTPGSAEMPSASRPFTTHILRQMAAKGVRVTSILLHTGVSSHEVETDLLHHPVLPEWFAISERTAAVVNQAIDDGRRVIAVGTTVVRALESAVNPNGRIDAQKGWTTHLVTPTRTPPRVVTSLITGMHDNHSSHLALMYAFVPPETLKAAYRAAADHGYLWHEFGDLSIVL